MASIFSTHSQSSLHLGKFDDFMVQRIIQFHEVTSVRRAKTAGIFHNAIEIIAGGRKVH